MSKNILIIRICQNCFIEFMGRKTQKYCCKKCHEDNPKTKEKKRLNAKKLYYENIEKRREYTRNWAAQSLRKKKGLPIDFPRMANHQGEGHISKKGYRYFGIKGHPLANKHGRVPQHTMVMTEFLGRPLNKGESVHHKNGIRHDNRIENLELWHKGQPSGQRVEDKIKWCKEFLKEYGIKCID